MNRSFGGALRDWRRHRGLSQLGLSFEAGVSPRHISFLETGRSSPSQKMILRLAAVLDVPLRERNRLLLAAGFAPLYAESGLDDAHLEQIRRALRLLLDRHDPYPAYAMDGAWNVLTANRTHAALLEGLLPDAGETSHNILRLLFSPRLLRPFVANWEACARAVLQRVDRQLDGPEGTNPELAALVAEIREYPDVEEILAGETHPAGFDLFIPVALRWDDRILRWMTTIVTLGGAIDVTLAELTVECFFPADEETERFAQELAGHA